MPWQHPPTINCSNTLNQFKFTLVRRTELGKPSHAVTKNASLTAYCNKAKLVRQVLMQKKRGFTQVPHNLGE